MSEESLSRREVREVDREIINLLRQNRQDNREMIALLRQVVILLQKRNDAPTLSKTVTPVCGDTGIWPAIEAEE